MGAKPDDVFYIRRDAADFKYNNNEQKINKLQNLWEKHISMMLLNAIM